MKKSIFLLIFLMLSSVAYAGITNFPNGVSSFGIPLLGTPGLMTTGKVFFLNGNASNASDNNAGTNKDLPLATLDGAIGKCTSANGDIIIVLPGHTESFDAASDCNLDVANVTIYGLGQGEYRPVFSWTGATLSDINVNSYGISIENVIFTNVSGNTGANIDVNAADFTIKNCEFRCPTANLYWINADANADRLKVVGCLVRAESDGQDGFISFAGLEDMYLGYNNIVGDFDYSAIKNSAAAFDICIERNIIDSLDTAATTNVYVFPTTDGTIQCNSFRLAAAGLAEWVGSTTSANIDVQLFENYGVNTDGYTGKLIGKGTAW